MDHVQHHPPARQILHVDMDAFFASVEQRDDPTLRGKAVLVGGPSRRGVVAAASYEARKYGVHSAMPMAEALRRCPHAVCVAGRHARDSEVSEQVFDIFARYTPLVEGLSVDEAFLDVTACRSLFGDGVTIARRIKDDIRSEVGITASAGVAECKFAAKVASDLQKPDGLVVVPPGGVALFLAPLPIERMWGVGPKAAEKLRAAGLLRIGDLASAPMLALTRVLGASWGDHVRALARGEDLREVNPGRSAVSIGAEETFEDDLIERVDLERRILSQAGRVAARLHQAGTAACIVVLKVKYSDFTLVTRRTTLPEPVADTDSIYRAACALLDRVERRPVRLTGVSVSGLGAGGPVLFPDVRAERGRKIEGVMARLTERYGARTLTRAALLDDASEARPGNLTKQRQRP
ncbi:MAG: DNA polymerase IV [Polyangiaceae bacterium]